MSGRKKFLAILFVEMALSKTEKNAIAGHRLVPVVILVENHHQPNAQMVNAAIWKYVRWKNLQLFARKAKMRVSRMFIALEKIRFVLQAFFIEMDLNAAKKR